MLARTTDKRNEETQFCEVIFFPTTGTLLLRAFTKKLSKREHAWVCHSHSNQSSLSWMKEKWRHVDHPHKARLSAAKCTLGTKREKSQEVGWCQLYASGCRMPSAEHWHAHHRWWCRLRVGVGAGKKKRCNIFNCLWLGNKSIKPPLTERDTALWFFPQKVFIMLWEGGWKRTRSPEGRQHRESQNKISTAACEASLDMEKQRHPAGQPRGTCNRHWTLTHKEEWGIALWQSWPSNWTGNSSRPVNWLMTVNSLFSK